MMEMKPWSATGPLEPGITLIEASAGTGKTYNITSLFVRLVAEKDVSVERILVVTYTRAATAELEERIRIRLVEAVDALGAESEPADEVLAELWREPSERGLRQRRLRDAVEGFDKALISTIHGFCQRMLQQHAFESGVRFDLELTPELGPVVEEIVDDWLSAAFYAAEPDWAAFLREWVGYSRAGLIDLAKRAVEHPGTAVVPAAGSADPSDWDGRVAELMADWDALADGLVQTVSVAVEDAKAGRPSRLKKRQRSHSADATRKWVDQVAQWLASDPPIGSEPPKADRFSAKSMEKQLADADRALEHSAIDRLAELLELPGRVAGAMRAEFVEQVRLRFDAAKEQRRLQSYDDLLRSLAERLDESADPGARAALSAAIGGGFDAALIDEFQDTDDQQWTLFREVFGKGGHHLYLIGDPKQAIYGFRGANVHVYAEASEHAKRRRYTMSTNWRSDGRLLSALNHLLGAAGMFGPSVSFGYVQVQPPPGKGADGLRVAGGAIPAPLQIRWISRALTGTAAPKPVIKGALEGPLPCRVAEDVAELLGSGTEICEEEQWRAIRPGDIAVLVRTGRQAVAMQEALRVAGVPAVLSGAASVLASDEAREVQHWLEALVDRSGGGASRVAASTGLFGWSARDLHAVEAEQPEAVARWERWLGRVARWKQLVETRGFMAGFRQALDEEEVLGRLLRLEDGERRVTNLLHTAELVHAAETRERLPLLALTVWLTARRSADDLGKEEVELRLDRDAQAVRILTIHKSKGLEFPVCFVPYLWDGGRTVAKANQPLLVPDAQCRTRRIFDVGVPNSAENRALSEREDREEALRLAYVALTRARHRVVVYAGLVTDYPISPLAAIFHGSGPDRLQTAQEACQDGEDALWNSVQTVASGAPVLDGLPTVDVSLCLAPQGVVWTPPEPPIPTLGSRVFKRRSLDPGWRRHSYTSVTREAGHPVLVEEGREGFDPDFIDRSAPAPTGEEELVEVPLAPFRGGAEAGTLLHEIFEHTDFTDPSPDGPLSGVVARSLATHGFDEEHAPLLCEGLALALSTPLGAVLGERRLADIPRADRLDELRFDLPILGGTRFRPGVDSRAPARALVEAIRLRPDALPSDWLDSLDRLDGVRLAGFLTGSIDLVFRTAGAGDSQRWFVVDYKSNRLDPKRTGRCVPEAFSREGMTAEMARHDYFLQYHLYLVALHRFLGWRVEGYDYDTHMGGVYYLFFRGMLGPDTAREGETVHGCWFDRPERAVIEALDAALELPGGEG